MRARLWLAISDGLNVKNRGVGAVIAVLAALASATAAVAVIDAGDWWAVFWRTFLSGLAALILIGLAVLILKLIRPTKRFKIATLSEKTGHPTAHGHFRPSVGRQPLGKLEWQVVYPNELASEWLTREGYKEDFRPQRGGDTPFSFPHEDQWGEFTIRFRGIVRMQAAPVRLCHEVWVRHPKTGWNRW